MCTLYKKGTNERKARTNDGTIRQESDGSGGGIRERECLVDRIYPCKEKSHCWGAVASSQRSLVLVFNFRCGKCFGVQEIVEFSFHQYIFKKTILWECTRKEEFLFMNKQSIGNLFAFERDLKSEGKVSIERHLHIIPNSSRLPFTKVASSWYMVFDKHY